MSLYFLEENRNLSTFDALLLTLKLSWPTMVAQISSVFMQYIDAAMVGRLGAMQSAAIGLVASSTWLMGGLSSSFGVGFVVLVSQYIGAGRLKNARNLARQGLIISLGMGFVLMALGLAISPFLPFWLGGDGVIACEASSYFSIVSLGVPVMQMTSIATGMLQATGHMLFPGVMNTLLCIFDVLFNMLFIFPSRKLLLLGHSVVMPGFGYGVAGAALGTLLSYVVVSFPLLFWLCFVNPELKRRKGEPFRLVREELKRAMKLSLPVAIERVVLNGAQVVSTLIVSPLGPVALAANSFAVTAESVCYMPSYGVQEAASTMVGQCVGAKRKGMAKRLAWTSCLLGMALMVCTGWLMFHFAREMIALITPDWEIQLLGASLLRIEAFAEPLFGASIIITGSLRGAGDTKGPTLRNLVSMWLIRLPLAALLSHPFGLVGVWIAMSVELSIRGVLFLVWLGRGKWLYDTEC